LKCQFVGWFVWLVFVVINFKGQQDLQPLPLKGSSAGCWCVCVLAFGDLAEDLVAIDGRVVTQTV
jgi:hypothetical protein